MGRKKGHPQYPRIEITKESARHQLIDSGTAFTFEDAPLWFKLKFDSHYVSCVKMSFKKDNTGKYEARWSAPKGRRAAFITLLNLEQFIGWGPVSVTTPIEIMRYNGQAIFLTFSVSKNAKSTPWKVDYCFFWGKGRKRESHKQTKSPEQIKVPAEEAPKAKRHGWWEKLRWPSFLKR